MLYGAELVESTVISGGKPGIAPVEIDERCDGYGSLWRLLAPSKSKRRKEQARVAGKLIVNHVSARINCREEPCSDAEFIPSSCHGKVLQELQNLIWRKMVSVNLKIYLLIRRIDVNVKNLYWAESGDLLTIASDSSFYILKYNGDFVSSYLESGNSGDEGAEDAFEMLHEINERVRTAIWVGDCFIYNNSSGRLNYCVGGEVTTMFHLDRPMYLLGYLARQSRVYLIDKEFNVMGYTLLLTLIEYKTLVMRGDLDRANDVLLSITKEHHNKHCGPFLGISRHARGCFGSVYK